MVVQFRQERRMLDFKYLITPCFKVKEKLWQQHSTSTIRSKIFKAWDWKFFISFKTLRRVMHGSISMSFATVAILNSFSAIEMLFTTDLPCKLLRKGSRVRTKIRSDRGQPCLIPFCVCKAYDRWSLTGEICKETLFWNIYLLSGQVPVQLPSCSPRPTFFFKGHVTLTLFH